MWTLRPAHLLRCAPTLATPATRSTLVVQHLQARNAQTAAASLAGPAEAGILNAPRFLSRPINNAPPSTIAFIDPNTQNTPSTRTVAKEIRRAIQSKDFGRAFQLHRNFQASLPASIPQSRLVTTTLIHALLRAGRRFKAAQVAEVALLGSSPPGPSIFRHHRTSDLVAPIRLSARTSEAIILALCPIAATNTPAPPPWRLFLTPDQIGQNAVRELDWRRKLANEELDQELKIAADGDGAFLPDITTHNYFVRHLSDKSDGITCRQEKLLDKSTRRALTFLRVARKAKQRRTSMMFQALIDACLLQGEIIIGTLLFVLLVKEWNAAKTAVAGERNWPESDGLLRISPIPSSLHLAVDHDSTLPVAPSPGRGWVTAAPLHLSSIEEPAQTPGYHPELSPPVEKPKHRPKSDSHPSNSSEINHLAKLLLGTILSPIEPPSNRTGSRSTIPHILPSHRYPRVPKAKSESALSCIVNLIADGSLHPISPLALDSITHYLETNSLDPAANAESALIQECSRAIETVLVQAKPHISHFDLNQFHVLLRAAGSGLGSTAQMAEVLEMMDEVGLTASDDETLAILLRGCIRARDSTAAETIVERIRVVYEQRELAERPYKQLAEGKSTGTFDLRIPLVINGYRSFDANGAAPETKPYHLARSWLAQKDRVAEMLPQGPPVLLNALLEWLTLTGRTHFIAENIDYLMAVAFLDKNRGFKDTINLAASFGPEFYERLIKALQVDGGFVNLGFAERVWTVVRSIEAHSWMTELQRRAWNRQGDGIPYEPWSIDRAAVPMMEFYALGQRMRALDRPATWSVKRQLDSRKRTDPKWWHEPSMLLFGKLQEPTTTQVTSALRAMELHQSVMASPLNTMQTLENSWNDVKPYWRKAREQATSDTSPVDIIQSPGHSYWTAVLSVVSGLRNLVPVFDHRDVPARWPIVKEEGAYLVKIQPFEVSKSMNRALAQVASDMKRFGWVIGEVVPMSREEEKARRPKAKQREA